ncbi:MAG: hypothetical protein RI947_481 [Candidatus Parcubacteria bacterium]|jgi:ABC-type uncharacterized transport system involved in gliding motility auxiliary subunit
MKKNHPSRLNLVKLSRMLRLLHLGKKLVIVFAITGFIVANILLSALSLRLDLSNGKAYTLSPATVKIVKSLDDVVTMKFFASSNLPTRLLPLKTQTADLLREYKKAGGKNVTLRILDPTKDKTAAEDAQKAGIPELQFSQMEQDKFAVTNAYFGLAMYYGDKKEILPQVTDMGSLEYNLTAAVYKMQRKELPQVGIIDPGATVDPQSERIGLLKQVIASQFSPSMIVVDETKDINAAYKAVVVLDSPVKEQSSGIAKMVQKYVSKGGKVILFTDGVNIDEGLSATPADSSLSIFLKDYGITVQKNLVLSGSAELVTFGNQAGSFATIYPFWMKTNVFSKHSYFSNIQQLTYPWTSSLTVEKKSGVETSELVKSVPQSWEQKQTFILNPNAIPQPNEKDLKQFTVTARAAAKQGGELIVIPSTRFIMDKYLGRASANIEFVLNVLNEMISQGALTGIRQRAVLFYPLPELAQDEKDLIKYANILLLPIVFAVYGGYRLMKRR